MFTFHKPRVYRSTEGCCICRAKSSSSRFTDSRKYESDSIKCFNLKQPRYGEICNACVLLVKRYKRLPAGSNRHWGHVVDARAGPGTKSLAKHKKQKEDPDYNGPGCSRSSYNSKSLISEKFSKIFKKNKKSKANSNTSSTSSHSLGNSSYGQHFPITLENGLSTSAVGLQWQTRFSDNACRSRESANRTGAASINASRRGTGSIRRKSFRPRKLNSAMIENDVQFFDENEWQLIQSCCGPMYECKFFGGALIVDIENYKPCADHRRRSNTTEESVLTTHTPLSGQMQPPSQQQENTIIAPVTQTAEATTIKKPIQALKKHHLFFKRQSENFPYTDFSGFNTQTNNQLNSSSTVTPATKTDLPLSLAITTAATAAAATATTATSDLKTNINLTTTDSVPTSCNNTNVNTSTISVTPPNSLHSVTKITTPSSNPSSATIYNTNTSSNTTTGFLHKIKAANMARVSKHSLEKANAAVRILPSDFNDMRHIVKAVDKSYLLSKTHQQQTVASAPAPVSHQQQPQNNHISFVGPVQPPLVHIAKLSPTSSVSSSTASSLSLAPKFSDNSSDSGFDENLQDRKSASPLQEDTEIKVLARPSIPNGKKIFSTGGVASYCPVQSMLLQPGIEEATKLRQQCRQHAVPTTLHQRNYQNRTGGVKIAQIVSSSSASHKISMRALYSNNNSNNNNTITHENGVTTIVPASSLAASSQAAAMTGLVAPNTVSITPSPLSGLNNTQCKRRISPPIIGTGGLGGGGGLSINNNLPNLNQKIIFVKTGKYNSNGNNALSAPTAGASAPHNTNYHSSTMLTTTATTAPLLQIPQLLPPGPQHKPATASTTTLSNVMSGQKQNVCVKVDCSS